ncbi:unnamed protein product [Gongylonema pulchrum]|uniref:ACB domain-containing protein n=1 Tax=Gongylonema pulchrum TaxID=637853 RepID=A0A183DTW7_9BILA|nr:unnamed protein product [Gongylonema pulchrum]
MLPRILRGDYVVSAHKAKGATSHCREMEEDLERADCYSPDPAFEAAVAIVQNMPKKGPISISINQKLRLYSLFKQGTVGKCNIPCPPFWSAVERLKWYAWNSLGSMERHLAREIYTQELKKIINNVQNEYDIIHLANRNIQGLRNDPNLNGLVRNCNIERAVLILTVPQNEENSSNYLMSKRAIQFLYISGSPNLFLLSSGHNKPQTQEIETMHQVDESSSASSCSDDEYFETVPDHEQEARTSSSSAVDTTNRRHRTEQIALQFAPVTESRSVLESSLEAFVNVLTYLRRIVFASLSGLRRSFLHIRVRWKMILFVIVWPFVANFAMAYLYYRTLMRR